MTSPRWYLALVVALCAGTACSASARKDAKDAARDAAIDCGKANFLPLLNQVGAALMSDDVDSSLDAVGKTAEGDALACAVKAVVATLDAVVAPPVVGAQPAPNSPARALSNGRAQIEKRGWVYQ
jgi:hypothetical protein